METLERNQIRLILERQVDKSLHALEDEQKALRAKRAAEGILRSGQTVKLTVRNMEGEASLFIERVINDVSDIAQDIEAFNLITASLAKLFHGFQTHLDKAVNLVSIGGDGQMGSVQIAANELFQAAKDKATKLLEIHRFSFTRPSPGSLDAMRARISGDTSQRSEPVRQSPKNAGGKPLAKHWDEMWAHVAVQLWAGELQPKTQAEIKSAMFEWFNVNEIDIGDTAVTQRARQLWQAMQAVGS